MSARADMLPAPVLLDIMVEASVWLGQADAEATVRRAIMTTSNESRIGGEVCVVLTNDAAIQELNRTWRGIDKPTNVLSFPAGSPVRDADSPTLGDIVIAYDTTEREALAEGKPFLHHLSHLAVHGFLHLLGYDHQEDGPAEEMERREAEILAQLGVPDPYLVSDTTP
jgi:probable rRNA maturation factor